MNLSFNWLRHRSVWILGIASVAGLLIGYLLVPRTSTREAKQQPAPEVHLLGRALPLDDHAIARSLEWVRQYASLKVALELPDGKVRHFYMGQLGGKIDRVRLARLVRDARDPTSPLRRLWQSANEGQPLELPVPVVFDAEGAMSTLMLLKDQLDQQPVDARLDLEKRELLHEQYGRRLDVDATLAQVEAAVQRGERKAKVAFEKRKPKRLASELGNVKFDHVLGAFETPYNRAERYLARTFNLRLAASKLDGYVLLPGEVFDFNAVVGPRDEANGYKVAPVIAEGELVDGIGGGTCQISGTLHGAAFFAGLDIVERYPHTRPSSYIKMGLDATVVYPTINFRIGNPYDFPIVLHQSVKNGVVRAEILGPKRTKTVTMIRRIDDAIPYEQLERSDSELAEGVRVLAQRGVPGFKLHRYRIVREGRHAIRERFSDVYPPTTQIVRVGTGDSEAAKEAKDDPTPEYVADELLVMTQLDSEEDSEDVTLRETREPGDFGKYGWTEEAGMPVWKSDS